MKGLSWGGGVRGRKLGAQGGRCRDACVKCKSQNLLGCVELMDINMFAALLIKRVGI